MGAILNALEARFRPRVQRAINEAFERARESLPIGRIAGAIDAGDQSGAVELATMPASNLDSYAQELRDAYAAAGNATAKKIGTVPLQGGGAAAAVFNTLDRQTREAIDRRVARRVTEVIEDQREAIKVAIAAGLEQGRGARSIALDIAGRVDSETGRRTGGIVGLTSQQSAWTANFREELLSGSVKYKARRLRDRRLDRTIDGYIQRGEPVPANIINLSVQRYTARTQRYRGEVIARTEALNALRDGQAEAVRQVLESPDTALDNHDAVKVWGASGGERTREAHQAANGQEVPVDQPFIVDGELLNHPGDDSLGASAGNVIQCRCTVSYRLRNRVVSL